MNLRALWAGAPRAAKIYLAAAGGVAVAAVAATVTVAAASPSPSPSPSPGAGSGAGQAYCSTFVGHVASNLGKTPSQVVKAIQDAIGQTLGDAVKKGDLTQQQADAIKARLGAGNQSCPAGIGRFGGHLKGGPLAGGALPGGRGLPRVGMIGLNEYASALGISQAELQQDLRNGQTVKDVAASKGMDEAAFRSKLVSVTKSDLDARVKAGSLTQQQEDKILQRLQSGPLPLWDRSMRPRGPFGPAPSPAPTAGSNV